jgi:LPS sulfotransferase NodH
MTQRFDYFIVFAEMRTGSNFLESNLNALEGVACLGEAFNPHFIGYPNKTEVLGVTQAMREADPARLIAEVKAAPGLNGFRFFHDHDPRVLELALPDPRCAKIVLTRNPAESYVSWKIAQATGQWKLTNVQKRKEGQAEFDIDEFAAHLQNLQAFQVRLLNALQTTGQTAFYVAYEDLQDVAVMNGLATWLGVEARLEALDKSLKVQNPEPLADKVANFEEMADALSGLDRFNLTRTPNFEPRRGAAVPSYIAGARTPLLYLPIKGGPERAVARWLAALDGVTPGDLPSKFNQGTLRQWQKAHPGHRSFAVLRHPVARAHTVFCSRILSTKKGSFTEIRQTLKRVHKLPIPKDDPGPNWSRAEHRAAFLAFLGFLKANLAGQTGIRVDAHWATQAQILQGFSEFAPADVILREEELDIWLPALAMQLGHANPPEIEAAQVDAPFTLADIYDEEIEAAAQAAYGRDYATFGFGNWQG